MPEHDRASAEALIDELERLIKESRAQGLDECVIWRDEQARVALVAPGWGRGPASPPTGGVEPLRTSPSPRTMSSPRHDRPSEVIPPTLAPDRA